MALRVSRMGVRPKIDPDRLQAIVTDRQTVREELANRIVAEIEKIPAGYMTIESYKRHILAMIKALVGDSS